MKQGMLFVITIFFFKLVAQDKPTLPDTGISGVYEVLLGVNDLDYATKYFNEFGFTVIEESRMEAKDAKEIYDVDSGFRSIRMQNGEIDTHGLIRLIVWDKPLGPGVSYCPPETIGQRMAVMHTTDIFRINDIFVAARADGQKWLPTPPVADDLFGLDEGKKDFFNRPVMVREQGVYGAFFNHVFFQRYGYHIEGYGTINKKAPLRTSEFTHHDFIINAPSMESVAYLSTALGLKAEKEPVLDGDWQKGPKSVFKMADGDSHWYQGFVSPNNICGKLKFFIPTGFKNDRSQHQRLGELGITAHTFYTDKLTYVHQLLEEHNMKPKEIVKNEFGEESFMFKDQVGCTWQIIKKNSFKNKPSKELKFELTKR